MDLNSFLFGVVATMLLVVLVSTFGFAHLGSYAKISGNVVSQSSDPMAGHHSGSSQGQVLTQMSGEYADMPEKCRASSWERYRFMDTTSGTSPRDTKECLQYFS